MQTIEAIARRFVAEFGPAIENDEPIPGADAVDRLSEYYEQFKESLACTRLVVAIVEGGVVQGVSAPDGINVEVHDYDVEGCDPERLSTDSDGKEFLRGKYYGTAPHGKFNPDSNATATALDACKRLLSTVENTGGLVEREDGLRVPAMDEDWVDLGDAVVAAQAALHKAGIEAHLTVKQEVEP